MTKMAMVGHLKGGETKAEAAVLRALARAYAEGTHGKFEFLGKACGIVAGNGGGSYLAMVGDCTCLSGRNGQMCKHRAAYADLTGQMDALVPDFYARFIAPGQPTPPPAPVLCRACNGDGYTRMYTGPRHSDYWTIPCGHCDATGRVAA